MTSKIVVGRGEIQLLEPIQFDTAKSTIKAVSFPILDEVVDVLKSHDDVRMGVYGHTDSRGPWEVNERLSTLRAESVRTYLLSRGVSPDRVRIVGLGESRPVADNSIRLENLRSPRDSRTTPREKP